MLDPKKRFSSRVDNYVRYRPGYPPEILAPLRRDCGLSPASVIADVGSGTGNLSRLFLDLGCKVFGIEPNAEMRSAGEHLLDGYANFTSIDGSAEATTLPDSSVDFISAGQAFHWFQHDQARPEFLRILRPGGWVVLVWNDRLVDSTSFLQSYESLLQQFCPEYDQVNHRNVTIIDRSVDEFFADSFQTAQFDNAQYFDYEGLKGRLLSASYAPEPGHPNHEPMLAELRRIFDSNQVNGQVAFKYDTRLFYGKIT